MGRKQISQAESVRPADVRAHVDYILYDKPLPEEKSEKSSGSSKKAKQVTDRTFAKEVLNNKKPVLVDFFAVWCGPCQTMDPYIHQLAGEYSGKVKVVKVNVDANPIASRQFGVQSLPTFMLFDQGEPVKVIKGANPQALKQALDQVSR